MKNTQAGFLWITQLLKQFDIPYQIAGGLAARVYGSKRELADIDIDIPHSGFSRILDSVKAYIVYGPTGYKDDHWDLYVMTLCYQEQEIDLTSTDNVKIFNSLTGEWELLETELSKACRMEIMGINVPVIPKYDLLSYKKMLRRPVDLLDIDDIQSHHINEQEQFRKTHVTKYDLLWPDYYKKESTVLLQEFKDLILEIHHIGSTAVPGISAKSVIDIMIVVRDIGQVDNYRKQFESMQYHYMGEYGIPGRRYLWQTRNEIDFHLQVFGYDHIGVRNCLLFRDYLIKHPEKAKEYSAVKELASLKYPNDMHAYWQEKKSMVEKFLNEAIEEHDTTSKQNGSLQ